MHKKRFTHINNPRTANNDVLLILCYDDNKLCGYIGILPDFIYVTEISNPKSYTVPLKCGWLSCIWVHPQMRGKNLAQILTERANELWHNRLLLVNFTPQAKRIYDRTTLFTDLKICEGIRGYLRFNLHVLLPNRNPKFNRIKGLLKIIDFIANVLHDIRLKLLYKSWNTNAFGVEELDKPDNAIIEYISNRQPLQLTRRNEPEFNWIISYPWIYEAPYQDSEAKRYAFSSVAKQFKVLNLKLTSNNKLIAYLMLVIRDRELKVPYLYCDSVNIKEAFRVIIWLMLKMKLNTVTVFHPALSFYIQENTTPFWYKRKMKRHYLIGKNFMNKIRLLDNFELQDGDGDVVFT